MTAALSQRQLNLLLTIMAVACGTVVANIYYSQPLVFIIRDELQISNSMSGLIVTLAQLGYCMGLLFVVPAADLLENRKLAIALVILSGIGLLLAGFAQRESVFMSAMLLIGLGSVAAQVLVPYAAHLAPEAVRGQAVGKVMSGLMLGIMLARPIASFVTESSSWHVVFFLSAVAMILISILLMIKLPARHPQTELTYSRILSSMLNISLSEKTLQRRALYHAAMFGIFHLFWTAMPLRLAQSPLNLDQNGIALFALAGVAGSIAAPIAGRLADRGFSFAGTGFAMGSVALALLLTLIQTGHAYLDIALYTLAAIILDFGVTINLVIGQRAIFALNPAIRGRLNGIYMATFFVGGAAGSSVGVWTYTQGGWSLTAITALITCVAIFAYFMTEKLSAYRTNG